MPEQHETPDIPREEERELHELVEQGREILDRLDEVVEGLGTIASTLSKFLTEWEQANTTQPGPAATVTLTWRQPQPKGP